MLPKITSLVAAGAFLFNTVASAADFLRPVANEERGKSHMRLIQASDARYGYFMMDYNLRYKEQQGVSVSATRQQAEEFIGRYRNFTQPPSGYEVLISDQEIEELARVLEGLGLGFIFEDGLTYARTFYPNPAKFVYTMAVLIVPVRTPRQEITLRPEITVRDISLDPNLRNKLVEGLNFDLYPYVRVETFEGGHAHFENEMKRILGKLPAAHRQQIMEVMNLSLASVQQRNLPSPSLDTAKQLASTLFFHEIGEVLFATLPHDLREKWRQLINTPGTRLVPGIIVFKNQLKMVQQAVTNIGSPVAVPEQPAEENFADIFAMSVYPDNVYTAFGETLKPQWKVFIEEVLRYLRRKHQQGRNIWTIEDPEKIQEYEKMGVIVERDPFKADAKQELTDLIRPFLEAQIGANAAGFNKTLRNIAFNLSKVQGPFTAQNVNLAFQAAKVNLPKGKPGEIAGRLNQTSIRSEARYTGAIPQNSERKTLEASILRPRAAGERDNVKVGITLLFQQFLKVLNRDIGALEDGAQRPRLYGFRTMQGDNSSAAQILGMGQYDVAQTVTSISSSKTSDSGIGSLSSLNESRYNSMASFALVRHSSSVSPCVAHPGRAGTETEYPPIDSFSSIILNLRNILFNPLDDFKYNPFIDDSQAKISPGLRYKDWRISLRLKNECLRPRAAEEKKSDRLISPADYPPWVVESMEKAQSYLIEIKKIARGIISTVSQAGFRPPNQMEGLDEAIAQWGRLRTLGASLNELSKFERMFNDTFAKELVAVFEGWYAAIKSDSFYDYSKRHKYMTKKARIIEITQANDKMGKLRTDFEKACDKLVKYVNGLSLYLAVDPYNPESQFQKMFRKEDLRKIEKRFKREGFEPVKARGLLVRLLSGRAQKILKRAFTGEIVVDAKTCEIMAQDLVRHFYPELSRRFFSVADDRARIAQIRQEMLNVSGTDRETLFIELIDVIDRGYVGADETSLVGVRHAAQDVLFTHFSEIGELPTVSGLLKERVVEWMEKETQFTRWDSLLRLFGDLANHPENLAQLRKLYQINRDFSIALQIIAVYTQVMTNVRASAQSNAELKSEETKPIFDSGLENVLDQINALSSLRHDPIISNYLNAFRQYVINHWAHWDRMKDFRYLQEGLKGGPMTFTHAMLWSESTVDAHAPNLWKVVTPPKGLQRRKVEALPYPTTTAKKEQLQLIDSNERLASEKLRTYLTDIIHSMNRARDEIRRQSLSSILRPVAAAERDKSRVAREGERDSEGRPRAAVEREKIELKTSGTFSFSNSELSPFKDTF